MILWPQLEKYLADGMIAKGDLPGDTTRGGKPPKWVIDDRTGAMVDVNSGRSYNMGDRVKVYIAGVDLAQRKLDLAISDADSRAAGKAKNVKGLTLGGGAGGMGESKGAGFGSMKTPGAQRRSRKSKSRDRNKSDYRKDRKGKGKRQ